MPSVSRARSTSSWAAISRMRVYGREANQIAVELGQHIADARLAEEADKIDTRPGGCVRSFLSLRHFRPLVHRQVE